MWIVCLWIWQEFGQIQVYRLPTCLFISLLDYTAQQEASVKGGEGEKKNVLRGEGKGKGSGENQLK